MFEPNNTTDVFTRNVIVGLSSFLYDVINIKQVVKGEIQIKRMPFFYSMTGEEQFIQDYFANTDKYCNILSPKIEGNTVRIPSGVFTFTDVGVRQQDMTSGNTRAEYVKTFETDFGDEERNMSARTDFIPLEFGFEAVVKCGSDVERLKIFQEMIRMFYKQKKFYIKFEGFNKLPVTVSFPESYNIAKNFQFKYGQEDKRPKLTFQLQVVAYQPIVDISTERFLGQKIDNFTFKFNGNHNTTTGNNDGIDPNDKFK
jgi:hypothetical protein